MPTFEEQRQEVIHLAQFCAAKGWLPATSGNLSTLVSRGGEALQIAITRSGADKQQLSPDDVLLIDEHMHVLNSEQYRPSAETSVHVELYQKLEDCGCILHVHTIYNNLISELYGDGGGVDVNGHELLKALGHWEEDASIRIPIVPNWADLGRLGRAVGEVAQKDVPLVLVRNHGIYAWGDSPAAARRHLEAAEFLFEYLYRLRSA
ncbi:methylthioribulose 1-phosphate dehydratase [Alicyclobacillus acidiphilus]|uniref:methylthioribulose 1-phosphate dehydratase n=1 Tax=Alicyclobacillus acidiphilus TaxID=182455 RepID=UPI00082C9AF0|nr:methylthioribulose 1-phosphate dehydratase [Alicyclobacillus acidiphilus]